MLFWFWMLATLVAMAVTVFCKNKTFVWGAAAALIFLFFFAAFILQFVVF